MALLTNSVVSMLSVEEVYVESVEALTAMSSALSTTSSLLGGGIPSSGLAPLQVVLFGVGWNSVSVFGLILLGCLQLVCYLFEIIHPNRVSRQKNRKKKRGRSNWRRRATKFRRRSLHVNLVKRCRRRVGNRPQGLNGSRFCSRRDRNTRQRCHREEPSKAKERYRAPSWLCLKFAFLDDFPTATLDAKESGRWHQYPDEFLEIENHVGNDKNLQARAEVARRPRDDNRGRGNENATGETFFGSRSTARVLGCWRRTSQHSVVGRLITLANDSAHLGYSDEQRSSDNLGNNFGGASAQLILTNRVSIHRDRRTRVFDRGRKQRESTVHRLQRKCLEVHALQRESQSAADQTPIDITLPSDLLVSLDDDWSSDNRDGNSSSVSPSESEGEVDDNQSQSGFNIRGSELNDVLQFRLRNNRDFDDERLLQRERVYRNFDDERQHQRERVCLLQREQL